MQAISKAKILDSSLSLFMKYGIKSVSMDDIARLLGISKKTIYNFIQNKKGLVHSVVSTFLEDERTIILTIADKSTNAIDEMITIARHVQKTLKKMKPSMTYDLKKYHPETWQIIEIDHFKFIEKHISNNLKRGKSEGLYRAEINNEFVSKFFVSLSRMIAESRYDTGTKSSSEFSQSEIYEHVILYHLNSITNPKGKKELAKHLKTMHT